MGKKMYSGVCKFCGQNVLFEALDPIEEGQENEIATRHCSCKEAQKDTEIKERIRRAREAVEGFTQQTGEIEIGEIIVSLLDAAARNKFKKVQIATNGGAKFTIRLNVGEIQIDRQETITDEVAG